MQIKRIISLLLVLLMTMAGSTAFASKKEDYLHLTVGNTTRLTGYFVTNYWGNSTSDIDVRKLLFAYSPVEWSNESGMFVTNNMVVSGLAVTVDSATGNKTYDFILQDDLAWSDGTGITAWDYAFSFLMRYSPVLRELGAVVPDTGSVAGSMEYLNGTSQVLTGVRVLSDTRFTITLDGQFLPYFYELGLMMEEPYPISEIAPGCQVADNGNGVSIEGPFTAELLKKYFLDENTGYMSHPSLVSGPYSLVSFDGETAEFTANPYFKGNIAGVRPRIENLTFTYVQNETMIDRLVSGDVDLLNKATNAGTIRQGMEMGLKASNYARSGLSYMAFACERPTVCEKEVRQAIAYCLNKNELVSGYVGDFGLKANGYYGIGQWMVQLVNGSMTAPEDENDWDSLTLDGVNDYEQDTEKAEALLNAAGWTLNQNGTAYTGAEGEVRAKVIDGTLVPLALTLVCPAGNAIIGFMDSAFVQPLAQVGIHLTVEAMAWNDLLDCYYRRTERNCDLMFLASNFDVRFDPFASFAFSEEGPAATNFTAIQDEALLDAALTMRRTEPGKVFSYVSNWIDFQKKIMDALPVIPIYSNLYYDFSTDRLQNYRINAATTWSLAVVDAYLSDAPDETLFK